MSKRVLWALEHEGADGIWRVSPDEVFMTRTEARQAADYYESVYVRVTKYEAVKS